VQLDRRGVLEARLGAVRAVAVAESAPGALVELVGAVVTVAGVDVVAVARLADPKPVHLPRQGVAVGAGVDRDQCRGECGRGNDGRAGEGAFGQGETHQLTFLGRLRGELSGSGASVARLRCVVLQAELHPKDACRRPENLWVPRSRQSGVFGCDGRRWRDSAYGGRQTRFPRPAT